MKILIFTNKFDRNDDLLGFFVGWIKELAKSLELISVVTQYLGEYPNLPNLKVYSLEKSKNKSKLGRAINFWKYLWRLRRDYDLIFVFMAPGWVAVSWPFARILGKKLTFWYAVWKSTFKLRLATWLSDGIVSSVKTAFPFSTPKLNLTGQGIDVDYFNLPRDGRDKNKILFLGRISPVKKIEILLEAISKIKRTSPEIYEKISVDLVGGTSSDKDQQYLEKIKKISVDLGIDEKINWAGKISHSQILSFYQRAGIFINLTPTGSFDKTMLEAMACGDLSLVSNRAMNQFFNENQKRLFMFEEFSAEDLLVKLRNILSLEQNEMERARVDLRNIIVANHSRDNLVRNLVNFFNKFK